MCQFLFIDYDSEKIENKYYTFLGNYAFKDENAIQSFFIYIRVTVNNQCSIA